jgi:hypothetical protein
MFLKVLLKIRKSDYHEKKFTFIITCRHNIRNSAACQRMQETGESGRCEAARAIRNFAAGAG